jgi:hypothetical protein
MTATCASTLMTAAGIASDQPVIAPPIGPQWREYLSLHAATAGQSCLLMSRHMPERP